MKTTELAHGRRYAGQKVSFFTIAEVAELVQVAPRTVRRWIQAGGLVAHRVGRIVRIADGDLHAFLVTFRKA